MWEEGKPLTLISKGESETPGHPAITPAVIPPQTPSTSTGTRPASEENCGDVAIGGGGGVASGDGTIYFLSPEQLNASEGGVQNAPNLYVVRPGRRSHFVATLESSANAALPNPIIRSCVPSGLSKSRRESRSITLTAMSTCLISPAEDSARHRAEVRLLRSSRDKLRKPWSTDRWGMEGNDGLPCELAVDQSNGDFYVPAYTAGACRNSAPRGTLSSIQVLKPAGSRWIRPTGTSM